MGMPEERTDYYTYGDYLKWPEGERWELIDGRAYAMTPSPTVLHQDIFIQLIQMIGPYFEGKPCKFMAAPLDVRLPHSDEATEAVDTVVQPDLMVVCDPAKVEKGGVRGAPDLVVEILSESTMHRDMDAKLRLYERHGVRCYIIVDPWGKVVTVRTLESEGKYGEPEFFTGKLTMTVRIFEGLTVDLRKVWGAVEV